MVMCVRCVSFFRCGGKASTGSRRNYVLIVLIFLHLFEKSRVDFFVRSRWLNGLHKNTFFIMLPSATGVAVIPH
jgi:hypothetical protein